MLDPNYNLTVLEHMLRERQRQLQREMETDWQLRTLLAERLGALDRLRLEGRLAQGLPGQASEHPR